eukprot:3809097-Ditylum_brightwellii.AAC.1
MTEHALSAGDGTVCDIDPEAIGDLDPNWTSLPAEDRVRYEAMAVSDRECYNRDYTEYHQQLSAGGGNK